MIEAMIMDVNIYNPIQTIIQKEYKSQIELKTLLKINKDSDYDFWSNEELKQISKLDLSTPIKDNEDYSQW